MNLKFLILCTAILLISNVLGHYMPPFSIMFTPIAITFLTVIIFFKISSTIGIVLKSIILAVFISANDICIKLFAGGNHDSEGLGWIHMMLFIGLIVNYIVMIIMVVNNKEENLTNKLLSLLIFPALMYLHLELFAYLGL